MTSAPADLLAFRADIRAVTGLGASEVGIVGDGAHQRTGGYHEGVDVLKAIGRYHGPASANVGSGTEDYSARQSRDRNGLSLNASATDVGSAWRNGGRTAWLRFNNALYAEMRDRPASLPALRAINVSLDGRTKQRYDQLRRSDGLVTSKDTVDTHTHLSFWRDTEGRRQPTLARIVELARAAVANTSPAATTGDDDMSWGTDPLTQGNPGYAGHQHDTALAFAWQAANEAKANTDRLLAASAADQARDEAMLAAITALTVGGNIEVLPVIAAINAVGAKVHDEVTALQERLTESRDRELALQQELADVRAAAEVGLSPAERAQLGKP